jgi:hypothetical protein
MHGFLKLGKIALHEGLALRAVGDRDFDAGRRLAVIFAVKAQQDSVAEPVSLAQPQSVVKTFHRRGLADIDVVVLWRRDRERVAAFRRQPRECQRLVAIFLM